MPQPLQPACFGFDVLFQRLRRPKVRQIARNAVRNHLAVIARKPDQAIAVSTEPAGDVKPRDRGAHGRGVDIDAALAVMGGHRGLDQLLGKPQPKLTKSLAVGGVGLHFGGIAVIEARIVPAVIARLAGVDLFGERFELHRVGTERQRVILLLIEELLARGVEHARRIIRAEHRVRIDLHALPRRRISNVVGVPPLHLHVDERGTQAPREGDAVAGHFARAGRARMQAIRIAGRENDRACEHDDVVAGDAIQAKDAADCAVGLAQQGGGGRLLHPGNAGADDLLPAQIHERYAGIALDVRRDAANPAGAGHDVAGIVAPEIKARLFELRVIRRFDPGAAPARPMLVDEKLVMVLDQEFRRVAGLLFGVAQRSAGNHQVSGEQGCAAFPDEALADDERLDAVAVQVERRVAPGGAAADDRNVCSDYPHRRLDQLRRNMRRPL